MNEFDYEEVKLKTIMGHKVSDLIILAELYSKENIVLENVAEAFKIGFEMGQSETEKAFTRAIKEIFKK